MIDFTLTIDRSKIVSEGRRAIGEFLNGLQVYKATADYKRGEAFFNQYTEVDDTFPTQMFPEPFCPVSVTVLPAASSPTVN